MLYRPVTDPPHPCVVLAHGAGADPSGPLGAVARRLTGCGLAALAFDYRRFGASDGQPRHIVNVNEHLEDWAAALAFVRKHSDLDSDRTGLWGSSLSGGEVIAVAARDQRVSAAVAQVPYCDGYALARAAGLRHNLRVVPDVIRDLLRSATRRPPHLIDGLGPPGGRAVLSTRYSDLYSELTRHPQSSWGNRVAARSLLSVYRFRPIEDAPNVRCPLLVVVTYQDRVAPPAMAIRAAHSLPYVELAMFSGRHFDMYVGEVSERASNTEARFLAHHLGVSAKPSVAGQIAVK